MRQSTSRYSPVVRDESGSARVELAQDHPGCTDPIYRARRDALAQLAASWRPGQPVPRPSYLPEEHEVWAKVSEALASLHERHAASAFLEGKQRLALPADRVPQLDEVSELLAPICGFRYLPVAGLAPLRDFYGSFTQGVFWSTQYLRHHSVPLYTPEPDVIHEVIGHANQLAGPHFAELYRLVGEAVARTRTDAALGFLSKVFWFSMEFGVLKERGQLKAFGAGILSSVGETSSFATACVKDFDFAEMGFADYDITRYQPVLYCWPSFAAMVESLGEFFAGYSDSTPRALIKAG